MNIALWLQRAAWVAAPVLWAVPNAYGVPATQPATTAPAIPAARVATLGDALDLVEPPLPWFAGPDSEAGHRRYLWLQTNNTRYHQFVVADGGAMPADKTEADLGKEMAEQEVNRMKGAANVTAGPEILTDPRFACHLHWRERDAEGNESDRTRLMKSVGGRQIFTDLWINIVSKTQVKTNAAVTKIAEDVTLSIVPHGTAPTAEVEFNQKPLLIRHPRDGMQIGDTPKLKAVNAINNKNLDLADYRGKVVVVDFWASWCAPCMQEAAHMVELNQTYGPKGVQLIGVNMDTDREQMKSVVQQQSFAWPHVFGGKGWESPTAVAWGVTSIPVTFILDPNGEVIWRGNPQFLGGMLEAAVKAYPPGSARPPAPEKLSARPDAIPSPVAAKPPLAVPAAASADSSPAAGTLAEARKLKSTDPAGAYAALKRIIKASPGSADARSAMLDTAAIEADPAIAQKVMAGEGKAYASLKMADTLEAAGKSDKARERYEQIVKDFPDTLCAATSRQKLVELKAPGNSK